jgi:hypothetical protein
VKGFSNRPGSVAAGLQKSIGSADLPKRALTTLLLPAWIAMVDLSSRKLGLVMKMPSLRRRSLKQSI